MAFTAYRTWVPGEVVTAAQLNEQLRDNGNYLKDGMEARIIRLVTVIDYNDGSPIILFPAPENSIILDVMVRVLTVYNDGAATVTIGDAGDADGFLTTAIIAPAVAGWKAAGVDDKGAYLLVGGIAHVKAYAAATYINLYQVPGTSTQGQIRVEIIYVPA